MYFIGGGRSEVIHAASLLAYEFFFNQLLKREKNMSLFSPVFLEVRWASAFAYIIHLEYAFAYIIHLESAIAYLIHLNSRTRRGHLCNPELKCPDKLLNESPREFLPQEECLRQWHGTAHISQDYCSASRWTPTQRNIQLMNTPKLLTPLFVCSCPILNVAILGKLKDLRCIIANTQNKAHQKQKG